MRCAQFTTNGQICVNECGGKGKKYSWFLTNAYEIKKENGGITVLYLDTLDTRRSALMNAV